MIREQFSKIGKLIEIVSNSDSINIHPLICHIILHARRAFSNEVMQ